MRSCHLRQWMDLTGIMLFEISQTEKSKYHIISLMCGIQKTKQMSKQKAKIRPTNTENKLMIAREIGVVGWAK